MLCAMWRAHGSVCSLSSTWEMTLFGGHSCLWGLGSFHFHVLCLCVFVLCALSSKTLHTTSLINGFVFLFWMVIGGKACFCEKDKKNNRVCAEPDCTLFPVWRFSWETVLADYYQCTRQTTVHDEHGSTWRANMERRWRSSWFCLQCFFFITQRHVSRIQRTHNLTIEIVNARRAAGRVSRKNNKEKVATSARTYKVKERTLFSVVQHSGTVSWLVCDRFNGDSTATFNGDSAKTEALWNDQEKQRLNVLTKPYF